MQRAAAELAGAFLAGCAADGVDPPSDLRLLRLGREPARTEPVPAGGLGDLHEQLLRPDDRARRGAWYTPRPLADRLVHWAVQRPGPVCDPACGGGVFLLAAADRLEQLGAAPTEVVERLLWGADVDELAIAVTEAELWRWAALRDRPGALVANLAVGDALIDLDLPEADAVVGNPPFLGQLKRATSAAPDRRTTLASRWPGAVRPYTDAAWLFLLAAVESVRPGGRVAMVQPQSVLAARDGHAVRARIDELADLDACWIDDGHAFAAAVDVCAPMLTRRSTTAVRADAKLWLHALLEARGVPIVELGGRHSLGDEADVVAGFRDEYYGLRDAVVEGGAGPRLVTSGAIDPLHLRADGVRFDRRRWRVPTVDLDRVEGRAARWLHRQAGAKVVVASQTKVIEAVVDPSGGLVAGVPAIAVVPHDPDRVWHVAAALCAPSVSAWLMGHAAGTALSADALRPTAPLLGRLPLPDDAGAWDRAAALARVVSTGGDHAWDELAAAADAAYGIDDPALRAWWRARRPARASTGPDDDRFTPG